MIILGIDPGLAHTGYAVLKNKGEVIKLVKYGCIVTASNQPTEKRIEKIYTNLKKITKKFKPQKIAVEQLFFCKNVKSALIVGHARGVCLLVAAENNTPLYEYTPLQVKQSLTGYGRAEKSQIQQMLKVILSLKKIPEPNDAADALAVAYCCLQTRKFS